MSDPRLWSPDEWSVFYDRFETQDDLIEAMEGINDIILEAEQGTFDNVMADDDWEDDE